MYSVAQQIEGRIARFGRGRIFFADDFVDMGSTDAVRQTLTRLNNSGMIVRVAQGMYCYPEFRFRSGRRENIAPSPTDVAKAVATHSHARIVPSGEYALKVLGLEIGEKKEDVPADCVYLTDGPARNVRMADGRDITFRRVAPKMVSFTNELALLLTLALMSIKRENVTHEHINHISHLLNKENQNAVLSDMKLMPLWIREIVNQAYNN